MKVKELLLQPSKTTLRDKALLLSHLLNKDHKDLYLMEDFEVPEEIKKSFFEALKLLERGYPLQYLLGEWEFYGRSFYVEEGVLIPRPETELLVEEVLKRLPKGKKLTGFEIGLGTGCISISLLLHRENLVMMANDINIKALRLAKRNAQRHGVYNRLLIFGGDLFEALKPTAFDFIVSNPPYIPEERWEGLPEGVKREGYSSLIGGPKGWEVYEKMAERIEVYLKKGGFFAFEIGHDQGKVLRELFEAKGYKLMVLKDYATQDRVVLGWRS
ncbi:MAG: peptide chain release factor N(5)-glutamine methyltransferase [Aquificaceae bacterium]